jgi:hypothetical protein
VASESSSVEDVEEDEDEKRAISWAPLSELVTLPAGATLGGMRGAAALARAAAISSRLKDLRLAEGAVLGAVYRQGAKGAPCAAVAAIPASAAGAAARVGVAGGLGLM